MTQAYVLMTALPPTYGHLDLIQFASNLLVNRVVLLLNTQPEEPMVNERYQTFRQIFAEMNAVEGYPKYVLEWQNEKTQQEPNGPDDEEFWANWVGNLQRFGFHEGDYIVASETYGVTLAEKADGVFMPYDPERLIRYTKGTRSRNDPFETGWEDILPEFRKYLQKTVTIFGAESTGKSTLTEDLTLEMQLGGLDSIQTFEWARPYLELVGPEVTLDRMYSIWEGQYALQKSTYDKALCPLVVQDTDLYTTVGFWEYWSPDTVPSALRETAEAMKSDLYIITRSNIPFEPDPLRYGGDERETPDQYWIDFCTNNGLPYVVLESSELDGRIEEAREHVLGLFSINPLEYTRIGAEYE